LNNQEEKSNKKKRRLSLSLSLSLSLVVCETASTTTLEHQIKHYSIPIQSERNAMELERKNLEKIGFCRKG
jgi:hypothetical protein